MPFRAAIQRRESLLLLVLAVSGAVIFLLGYRTQIPDSALVLDAPRQEVERSVERFLEGLGYDGRIAQRGTELRRNAAAIDSLQRIYGRPAAVRLLREARGAVPPGVLWRIRYEADLPGGREDRDGAQPVAVSAVPSGEIYAFFPQSDAVLSVDRSVLGAVLDEVLPAHAGATIALTRDEIAETMVFDDVEAAAAGGGGQGPAAVSLPSETAETMARAHLERTYWGNRTLRVDSVTVRGGAPGFAADVFFVTEDLDHLPVLVEARVTAGGALQRLSAAGTGPEGTGAQANVNWSLVVGSLEAAVYVILSLVLVVAFFRRTGARAVDFGAAVKDGILGAVLIMVFFGAVVFPGATANVGNLSGQIALAVGLLIGAGFIGLYLFALSGAADSAAREVWPEKLDTMALCRQSFFVNRPVGSALLRGVAGALMVSGAFMAVVWLFPGAVLTSEQTLFQGGSAAAHLAGGISAQTFKALLVAAIAFGGLASFLKRRAWPDPVAAGTVVLVLALMNFFGPDFAPRFHDWAGSAAVAAVLVALYWRYDYLTALVAIALSGILWISSAGWALGGSAGMISLAGGIIPPAAVLLVGFIGVRSGREGADLPKYVPSYIEELAHREHIERELDIARKVQQRFLPRRMPRLRGATVSALCIPAHEVGGDYYDFMVLDEDRLAIAIGDVSGKGIQAAFYMTLVKGFVQTLCCETYSPLMTLDRINQLFCRNAPRGTFVSLIFGILDERRGTFTFARAGHSPVIHRKADSPSPELKSPSGIAVGLTPSHLFRSSIREETIVLGAGDSLVLYTDGISEAVNRRNDQFGEARLLKAVGSASCSRAEQMVDAVSIAVQNFARGVSQHDDMTMVVLKMADDYLPESTNVISQETTACYVDRI